jgi:hypothetical protein
LLPQGLKPTFYTARDGAAEAAPCKEIVFETRFKPVRYFAVGAKSTLCCKYPSLFHGFASTFFGGERSFRPAKNRHF